jgi:Domain of unknown function (DUF4349)
MKRTNTSIHQSTAARILLFVLAASAVIAACSNDSADFASTDLTTMAERDEMPAGEATDGLASAPGEDGGFKAVLDDGTVVFQGSTSADPKIVRDGSVDLRIEPGTFDNSASDLRLIAADLGGYVASGESHLEELDDDRYAVGWFTIRIPSDRFDEAVGRIEQLGDRVSASLTSQDVTEEYVDLEGRLNYWREQEAFYGRLMAQATEIDDLVTIQTRMQDVLLNIEQIEGRLRYLDSRTDFATLRVGLTEVPDTGIVEVTVDPDPSPIADAFDQAGEVLLATVSFIIVAIAVAIPIGILVAFGYIVFRLFLRAARRNDEVAEA